MKSRMSVIIGTTLFPKEDKKPPQPLPLIP